MTTEQEKMPSVVHWGAVTNDPKAPSWFQGGAQYIRRDIVDGLVEALKQYTGVVSSVCNPNSFSPEVKDEGFHARVALTTYQEALK